jgi:nucleoid DNA-binding protein
MSITTLADALAEGKDLRIVQLGQIRVKKRPPRKITGNLSGKSKLYSIGPRKTAHLKAFDWLIDKFSRSQIEGFGGWG